MRRVAAFLAILILAVPLLAQRVDNMQNHWRIWAIDRVVLDAQGHKMPAHAKGKLAFNAIYNSDGSMVLVEYVASKNFQLDDARADAEKDRGKSDTDPTKVRVFEKGRTKKSDFVAAAKAAGFVNLNLESLERFFYVRVR